MSVCVEADSDVGQWGRGIYRLCPGVVDGAVRGCGVGRCFGIGDTSFADWSLEARARAEISGVVETTMSNNASDWDDTRNR